MNDLIDDVTAMSVIYFEPVRFTSSKYFWKLRRKSRVIGQGQLLRASKRLILIYAHQYAWKYGLHSSKTQFKKRNFRQVKKALEKKLGKKDWDIKPTIPYSFPYHQPHLVSKHPAMGSSNFTTCF